MTVHALLVGIDRYPGFGPETQLAGGVNDARVASELLQERLSLSPGHLVRLLGSQATRAAIVQALEAMLGRVRRDDAVFFYFSGHGSQITDREGDEGDGLDETLVPVDSGRRPQPNRDITDDEIYGWATRMLEKTPNLVLIFDCCHAATLHRPRWQVRSVPPDRRPVDQLPRSPLLNRDLEPPESPIVLAACGDHEQAYEMPVRSSGHVHGVFSHHLFAALREAPSAVSWRDFFPKVQAAVRRRCQDQVPVLSGAGIDRPWARFGAAAGIRGVETGAGGKLLSLAREHAGWQIELFRSRHGPWRRDDGTALRPGDRLRIDVSHAERRPHFVYLLDLGVTGRSSLIFPEPHGHEALDPSLTLTIGDRREDHGASRVALELFWPRDAPRALDKAVCHIVLVAHPSRLSYRELLEAAMPADTIVVARAYVLLS